VKFNFLFRTLTLTVAAVMGGALAELTGEGRLPFDNLRWHTGSPEVLVHGRWLSMRAVNDVPATTLVADEIAAEGPAFADRFTRDLEHLAKRRGSRWGPIITLEVEHGGSILRIHQLATRHRGRAVARAFDERTEPIGERADMPIPPRIDGTPSWPNLRGLTRNQANEDLGALAWHLAHRLASPRTDVPWREALASIRAGLGSGISRRDFAIELMSVLALFDDGHVRLKRAESQLDLSGRVLPVRLVAVQDGVACVMGDGRQFCSRKYPLMMAIDGAPIKTIFRALAPLTPRVSTDFQRREILELAREIDVVHGLVGGTSGETSTLLLQDGKGHLATQVVHLARARREPPHSSIDVRILPSGDGYLALRDGWPSGESFSRRIDDAFRVVHNAPRLIIDVRGNRGGNREPVLHLLRHIVPPDDRIIAIAAYRMDRQERPPEWSDVLAGHGFLPAARDETLLPAAGAQWALSPAEWSGWHVATLDAERHEPSYDGPVVVLVDEQSASATALLTSVLAKLDRVTIAGLEGGGGGGWPVDVRLPHSGFIVSLPSMFSVEPDGTARTAILPEVRHPRTIDDLQREMAGEPLPSWALTAPQSAAEEGLPMESGTTASPRTQRDKPTGYRAAPDRIARIP